MNDITIHYVKILEIEYFADDNDDNNKNEWIAGFELGGERYRLDDAMRIKDNYFDGAIADTYFSSLYVKILDDDMVAVAYVTC